MAQNVISLEDFKKAIKEHRSVIVTYSAGKNLPDAQLRYDMDEQGRIREVMTYARKVYFAARIEGDDERLAEKIYLETAKAITPTPTKDLKRIDCRYYDRI